MAKRKVKPSGKRVARQGARRAIAPLPLPSGVSPTALEKRFGLSVAFRARVPTGPPDRVAASILRRRVPLLGEVIHRYQKDVDTQERRERRAKFYSARRLAREMNKVEGTYTICGRRARRREHLFRIGVAGRNRRRSPGRGGSYRRTPDSSYQCRERRR